MVGRCRSAPSLLLLLALDELLHYAWICEGGELAELVVLVRSDLSQDASHDLSASRLGQSRRKVNRIRCGERADLLPHLVTSQIEREGGRQYRERIAMRIHSTRELIPFPARVPAGFPKVPPGTGSLKESTQVWIRSNDPTGNLRGKETCGNRKREGKSLLTW